LPCDWRTHRVLWRDCVRRLGDEKVNVLAMHLESSGVPHLVPDNPVHAAGLPPVF